MDPRYEANRQTGLWLERLVWNAAAGAVLAVMVLLLLESLRWLDQITPEEAKTQAEIVVVAPADRATEVAEFNRPSP